MCLMSVSLQPPSRSDASSPPGSPASSVSSALSPPHRSSSSGSGRPLAAPPPKPFGLGFNGTAAFRSRIRKASKVGASTHADLQVAELTRLAKDLTDQLHDQVRGQLPVGVSLNMFCFCCTRGAAAHLWPTLASSRFVLCQEVAMAEHRQTKDWLYNRVSELESELRRIRAQAGMSSELGGAAASAPSPLSSSGDAAASAAAATPTMAARGGGASAEAAK